MSIASENELIDRLAGCVRWFGCGDDAGEYDEQLQYADGHSGEGWYLGCGSYPDDRAEFIGPDEYGALVVAQAIVVEERAWLHAGEGVADAPGNPDPQGLPAGAPVSFVAQLMALGSADVLAEDLAAHGSTSVLIFAADVDEVRKAGGLFRKTVRLSAHMPRPDGAPVGVPEQAGGNTYSERGGA